MLPAKFTATSNTKFNQNSSEGVGGETRGSHAVTCKMRTRCTYCTSFGTNSRCSFNGSISPEWKAVGIIMWWLRWGVKFVLYSI